MYQMGAANALTLMDFHQSLWTLAFPWPLRIRSASQKSAFQEPIEVQDMTLTFRRALWSARNW